MKLKFSEEEWKQKLSSEEYRVLRKKGTEAPFSGKYNAFFDKGIYTCKGCGQKLFNSKNKFHSSCGWPSFDKSIKGSINYIEDYSHGMNRIEIICSKCGGHQGHIFNDGPSETGKRYCVNSISVDFTSNNSK